MEVIDKDYLVINPMKLIDKDCLVMERKRRGTLIAFVIPERFDDQVEHLQLELMLQLFPICSVP